MTRPSDQVIRFSQEKRGVLSAIFLDQILRKTQLIGELDWTERTTTSSLSLPEGLGRRDMRDILGISNQLSCPVRSSHVEIASSGV